MNNSLNLLNFFYSAGVDEFVASEPMNYFEYKEGRAASIKPLTPCENISVKKGHVAVAETPIVGAAESEKICAAISTLDELKQALDCFDGCGLKKFAMHTIVGSGQDQSPRVMCIGDMPNSDDDRSGEPFAGIAGELLDKMFGAIGLSRDEHVYLTHMINWRPPGNRMATREEIAMALPFIKKHIELVKPKIIVAFGTLVVSALLDEKSSFAKVQGTWLDYDGVPVLPIYSPTVLMKDPAKKKDAWDALQKLKERV